MAYGKKPMRRSMNMPGLSPRPRRNPMGTPMKRMIQQGANRAQGMRGGMRGGMNRSLLSSPSPMRPGSPGRMNNRTFTLKGGARPKKPY